MPGTQLSPLVAVFLKQFLFHEHRFKVPRLENAQRMFKVAGGRDLVALTFEHKV